LIQAQVKDSPTMSEQTNIRRGKVITVIVLLGVILLGMVIGAVSIAVAGPTIVLPEDGGMLRNLEMAAALLAQAGVA
jgi:hypothetical protein